ncbi:hypothetical protein EYC80_004064 [Monilinia laxa]|uniref:Uncharacterized protein n=1 Tax=Monilinia laxa TaxID=61186 RepID=A0A5N6KLZ6_MONLA|nr:hypothetical protein EYC80_004064 [Monilinia laxa]
MKINQSYPWITPPIQSKSSHFVEAPRDDLLDLLIFIVPIRRESGHGRKLSEYPCICRCVCRSDKKAREDKGLFINQ